MVAVPFFVFLAFLDYQTRAQSSNSIAQCTVTDQDWTTNDEKQSPCLVGNSLLNACSSEIFPLSQLNGSESFYEPPPANDANACTCSSVTYAMVSACAICQGNLPQPWDQLGPNAWITNCPANTVSVSRYPNPVPSGIFIPVWAFQNVSTTGMFDAFTAQQLSEKLIPDTTLGVNPVMPTSTSTTPSPTSASPTKSPTTTPTTASLSNNKKSNGGTIAGAVVGSIVGVVCLSLVAWLYYRKAKKPRRHFEGAYDEKKSDTVSTLTNQLAPSKPPGLNAQYPPLKLYDPEDPSTFPQTPEPPLSLAPTSPLSTSFTHSRSNSDEPLTRPGHSRQSSSDSSSMQSSLVSAVSSSLNGKNFNSGYNPSGIMFRTIPEQAEGN